ncbi:GAK5 protein, partial [Toxostoma redivivum]|nr:GAK5 protein [Toxostoma redivivum]
MATALAAMKGPFESAEVCFGCEKPSHLKRDCLAMKRDKSKVPPLCPQCHKGQHYANKCHSKYDAEGCLIQGNGKLSGGWHRTPIQMPQLPQQMSPQKPPPQISQAASPQVFA